MAIFPSAQDMEMSIKDWQSLSQQWAAVSQWVAWTSCISAADNERADPLSTHVPPILFPTSRMLERNASPASKQSSLYFFSHL